MQSRSQSLATPPELVKRSRSSTEVPRLDGVGVLRAGLEVIVEALVQLVRLALALRSDQHHGDGGVRSRSQPRARADRELVLDGHGVPLNGRRTVGRRKRSPQDV